MAYRSRSKYTPGGGVLAFFEQVSRFVSLSVFAWVALSVFLILFVADGKITDSFDLRLVQGVFTQPKLTWTALVLIAMNGVIGGLLSLPSAFVLFMTRQYLDFYSGRARRSGIIRIKIVKSLPVVVLLMTHFTVLFLNLVSAPQLTRSWFKQDSQVASVLAGSHFALSSLTRKSFEVASEKRVSGQPDAQNNSATNASQKSAQIIFIPADVLESEEFKSEQSKLKDAYKIPFVISKSTITDQLEELFTDGSGSASSLVRKTFNAPQHYGRLHKQDGAGVLISITPQLRFGRHLLGLATDSLAHLKDSIFVNESRRRLVSSQVQLFGVFRFMDGLPFLGKKIDWLDLVSDDVARVRASAARMGSPRNFKRSVTVMQLSGMERRYSNIHVPFRPTSWPEKISINEKKLIVKNLVRELVQYINDVASSENDLWIILPYADDKRVSPQSFALVKSGVQMPSRFKEGAAHSLGILNIEMGRFLLDFLGELVPSAQMAASEVANIPSTKSIPALSAVKQNSKIRCFETEIETDANDLRFQQPEFRERSLGELLNSLTQLPESDLSFLSHGALPLIARDPGFGFICKTENQSIDETYLVKPILRTDASNDEKNDFVNSSILVWRPGAEGDASGRASQFKGVSTALKVRGPEVNDVFSLKADVLREFRIFQLVPASIESSSSPPVWREFDQGESKLFFSKFGPETLQAVEYFARARIR